MIIRNSVIALQSDRTYQERYEKSEKLNMWIGNERPAFEKNNSSTVWPGVTKDFVLDLSDRFNDGNKKAPEPKVNTKKLSSPDEVKNGDYEPGVKDQLKIKLIEKFIEVLTGKKVKISLAKQPKGQEACQEVAIQQTQQGQPTEQGQKTQPPSREGWGLEYDYHERYYESEQTSFSATGIIKTADGKQINFDLQVNMSREFTQQQDIQIRVGDAAKVDPLIINFDGLSASLTDTKFNFDLDFDGRKDQISFVNQGSGFLAYDKNNDGIINNGSELFGPQTGNGFADLAQHVEDGNGWIDASDSIYDKLRIWTRDSQGNNQLFALGQMGIGAIYLGNVGTEFALKDSNNELQGNIGKTGIFVKENGTVGTIQHIDLVY